MEGLPSIAVAFVVGILSNLFTHYLLIRRKRESISISPGSWVELVLWSVPPILFTLLVWYRIQFQWPLTPGAGALALAASFVAGVGLTSLGLALPLLVRTAIDSIRALALTLATAVLAAMLGVWLLDRLLPNFIALDCRERIERIATLQGRIVDPTWRVYVLIRPRLSRDLFAVAASSADKYGVWYANCHFGGSAGEEFEVSAVALPPGLAGIGTPRPTPSPEWLDGVARRRTGTCVTTRL